MALAATVLTYLFLRPVKTPEVVIPSTPATSPHALLAIGEFWKWFESQRPALEQELSVGLTEGRKKEISRLIRAIHPSLEWDLAQVAPAQWQWVLSGQGQFLLRKLTQRWKDVAPKARSGWNFLPARPPSMPNDLLRLEGELLSLEDFRFLFEEDARQRRLKIGVFHRQFLKWDEEVRFKAATAACVAMWGEDEVESWVGRVAGLGASQGTQDAREARRAFLEFQARTEKAPALWELESRTAEGLPLLATLQLTHKRLGALDKEWHLEVRIPYTQTESGLPNEASRQTLEALEKSLLQALSTERPIWYGHLAYANVWRTLMYVPNPNSARNTVRAWQKSLQRSDIGYDVSFDAEWAKFRRF